MAEEVEAHVLRRYSLVKKVGSGAYGIVWKVTDKRTGETLALKKIFDAFQHSTDAQRTYREITLLQELDHPNVVRLQQVLRAENDKDLYLVFEFMEADLHNAVGQKILKDAHHRFVLYQLAKALKYLHSAQIIHRDLKPSNLLLNSDCTMKVCDFGLARSLLADQHASDLVLTEEVATRWYRAPEVLLGSNSYGKAADVWSMGCILAEMLAGKPLFPGNSTLNQLERILAFTGKPSRAEIRSLAAQNAATMIEQVSQTKQRPLEEWFKAGTPPEALDLLQRMLQFDPQRRPSAAEVLRSPYLASFSNPRDQVESKTTIKPPVSDNTKLGLKDYRSLIYEHIRRFYRQGGVPEPVRRPNTASKGERQESSGHSFFRHNSNSSKNEKPRTSETKGHKVCSEQQERLKKKNSLKEILKNKKAVMAYKPPGDNKPLPKKTIKDYEFCSSSKENRNFYGKLP